MIKSQLSEMFERITKAFENGLLIEHKKGGYTRPVNSVRFALPIHRANDVQFRFALESPAMEQADAYHGQLIVTVPFHVEALGDGQYLAIRP